MAAAKGRAKGDVYAKLQLLARHRRDLVKKRSTLQCQIREFLGRCLPGYGALFPENNLWESQIAIPLVREYSNADAIRAAGVSTLIQQFRARRIHFQARTIEKIVSWAGQAAAADPLAPVLQRIWCALDDVDPRDIHTRIANRATRVVFQIVSGGQVFQHPCLVTNVG